MLQTFRERRKDKKEEAREREKAIYMLMLSSALQMPRCVLCPLPSNKLRAAKPVAMFTQ